MQLILFTDGSLWLSGDNLEAANKLRDSEEIAGQIGKTITVHEFFAIIHPRGDSDEEDE